jgi:hypothetical protein
MPPKKKGAKKGAAKGTSNFQSNIHPLGEELDDYVDVPATGSDPLVQQVQVPV